MALLLAGFIFHAPLKFGVVCAAANGAQMAPANISMVEIAVFLLIFLAPFVHH
jgi:hypothetical protein